MKKIITLLIILILVFFMVGCENSINPIGPQTQNDNEGISLAKERVEKVKPDGNTQEATFYVKLTGSVFGAQQWPQNVSLGTKTISTPYGYDIELDLSSFDCFDGKYEGPLQVGKSKKNDIYPAHAWFWFYGEGKGEATDILYLLKMYGTFEDGALWPPPTVNETIEITLIDWELTTENKRDKNKACTGNGNFSTNAVTITRTL